MKKLITNYTFDASAQTLTLSDYATLNQEGLLLITNTTDNVIIYNFASSTYKATVSGNVISLTYNTTAMSDSDDIQIWYDDGAEYGLTDTELRASDIPITLAGETVTVSGTVTTGGLTDTQLRASDVPVTLGGESVAVTGSFYQATQPVSGPLTDVQLRAADVKVSLDGESVPVTGTFWQTTQPVSDSALLTELQSKTEPSDIQQTELVTAFRQLLLAISYPPHLDRTANRIRATDIIESGTITTVTTVTGITNIDGYQGKIMPINLSLSSWAQVVRNRIS